MSRNRTEPLLRIEHLGHDELGSFLVVAVTLKGETLRIRWGLNEEAVAPLRRALDSRPFDASCGNSYEYFIYPGSAGGGPDSYICYLEARCGGRTKNIPFLCGERFAGNLDWFCQTFFQNVGSLESLRHLEFPSKPVVPNEQQTHQSSEPSADPQMKMNLL
jgi:hypothetical protein